MVHQNDPEQIELPPDMQAMVDALRYKPDQPPPREIVLGNAPHGLGDAIAAMLQIRTLSEEQQHRELTAYIGRFEAFCRRWAHTNSAHPLAVYNRFLAADMRRWEAHRAGLPVTGPGFEWFCSPFHSAWYRLVIVRELRSIQVHDRRAYREHRKMKKRRFQP